MVVLRIKGNARKKADEAKANGHMGAADRSALFACLECFGLSDIEQKQQLAKSFGILTKGCPRCVFFVH